MPVFLHHCKLQHHSMFDSDNVPASYVQAHLAARMQHRQKPE